MLFSIPSDQDAELERIMLTTTNFSLKTTLPRGMAAINPQV